MKVLHAFNWHRGGGGSDNAWSATIALSKARGVDVACFERDSRKLSQGFGGKAKAFIDGVYAPAAIADFRQTLRREQPDLVHTHELYPLITPWIMAVCAEEGVPLAHAVYDFRLTCPVATHFDGEKVCTKCVDQLGLGAFWNDCRDQPLESLAFALRHSVSRIQDFQRRYVDQFIVLTPFTQHWLTQKAGVDPSRVSVNECVIPAPNKPVDPSLSNRIGYAGRAVKEKGIHVLLDAADRAGVRVALALPKGTKPDPDIASRTDCIVTDSREELTAFYRSCRALVVPSLWFETFAIVAAEAMAEGVPVIASRIGALQDTVINEETGLHFDVGDVEGLASQIVRVCADDTLCRRLGSHAYARVLRDFSEDAYFERLMKAYGRAMHAGDVAIPLAEARAS